jgi:nicotinate-nucleotide adenylyltransferase
MGAFEGARRLGVMGGTFDPPHNGHFQIAGEVAAAKQLDRVIFIPAASPWQKSEYSPAEDRFAMTVLGAAMDPRFVVSRIELDRKGPTYTVDTMTALSELCEGAELFVILGADAAINLGTWHRIEDLLESTKFLAVQRPGFDQNELRFALASQLEVVEVSSVDISSTQIRAAVREGRSIAELVPPAVAGYIELHHLYEATKDLQ